MLRPEAVDPLEPSLKDIPERSLSEFCASIDQKFNPQR
jgi:hypothetical protein